MAAARKLASREPAAPRGGRAPLESDDLIDQQDVPAAVLCALCGDPECPGCANEPSRSGVVAIVAWERPGAAPWSRLWSTARAATLDAERFFETLPDGPAAPALRFAVVCELLASSVMSALIAVAVTIGAPHWVHRMLTDEVALTTRLVVLGVPALAALLVAAHVVHGVSLDRAARRVSGRSSRSRALRFGLYAAGWDLVIGPVGVAVLLVTEGPRAALRAGAALALVPSRSARAFLRGAHGLDGARATAPLRSASLAAAAATLVGSLAVLAVIVAVRFL